MDFELLKREVGRSVQDLKDVMASINPHLLEDDDNQEVSCLSQELVRARMRDLMVTQTYLSRALYRTDQQWDLMVQGIAQVEQEDRRQILYDEARLHWNGHGGDQVQNSARELLSRLEVAIRLLEPHPIYKGTSHMETPAPPHRRVPLMTPVQTAPRARPEDVSPPDRTQGTTTHQLSYPLRHTASEDEFHPQQREAIPLGTFGSPIGALPQEQFVRLPKFDLPPFLGEIEQFPSFWDAYNSAVHANPTLSPVVKFHHLKNLLKGDAQAIVAGYDITAENYDLAVHTLRETYYRPQLIRTQLSTRLQTMRPAGTSALHQRTTLAQIKSLWLQLQKLGDHEDNIFVMRLIRQKFPQRTLEHLGSIETADPTAWKVPQLLDGLDCAIKTFETIADTAENKYTHTLSVHPSERRRSSSRDSSRSGRFTRYRSRTRSSTPVRRAEQCAFCRRSGHSTPQCHLVTSRQARLTIIIEEHLCRKCLAKGHCATECRKPPCTFCKRDHHATLCRRQPTAQSHGDPGIGERRGRTRYPTPAADRSSSRSPSEHRSDSRRREVSFRATRRNRSQSSSPARLPSKNSSQNSLTALETFDPKLNLETSESDSDEPEPTNITNCFAMHSSSSSASDPRLMVVTSRAMNILSRRDETLVMLLDTGAQHSFIREATAKRLGLRLRNPSLLTTRSFGGHLSTEMSSTVTVVIRDRANEPIQLRLRTRQITTSLYVDAHISEVVSRSTRRANTSRLPIPNEEVDVDILIGIDYFWSILDPLEIRRLPSGLMLLHTRFGPVVSGQTRSCLSTSLMASVSLVNTFFRTDSHATEPDLRNLWDLESIGIYDDPGTRHDEEVNRQVVQQFYDTVQVIDGLIYVQFPWKREHPPLPDNKSLALRRLEQQYQSLQANITFWNEYCAIFEKNIAAGVMEDTDEFRFDGPKVYYMPHQAVIKTDSATTAIRIVFDASSHYKGQPSLNDCLHQGPSLLPDLAGALLRARLSRYLLIADVEKAFHQIRLQHDQKDATRLLWLKDTSRPPTPDNLRILRFTRVVFGINVSPFLLNISIKFALERDSENSIREEVLANIYVDNVLIGANRTNECIWKQRDCKQTFQRMGMNLREFMSNNFRVMKRISPEDRMKITSNSVKLLGIRWNPAQDTLHITANVASFAATTKRVVLRAIASNFDPLGYLVPQFVPLKIFLQDLWRRKQAWDQPLKEEDVARWNELVGRIDGYRCSIPRFIIYRDEYSEYELLLFADASKHAFAAVGYLLSRSGDQVQSHLLMAKARVAPLHETTIPRLELMACHLAVHLAQFLHKELKLPFKAIRFFSDSYIALHWIHSESTESLKIFVANRVRKIRTVLDTFAEANIPVTFHYVHTEVNPADCATRGLSASDLSEHIWWNGPPYIRLPLDEWPKQDVDFTIRPTSVPETELEYTETVVTFTSVPYHSILPFERTNRYDVLVRITTHVLRFIRDTIYKRLSSESRKRVDECLLLSIEQLASAAELILSREHQREAVQIGSQDAYRDPLGIIRVNTRMRQEESPTLQSHPILLAAGHHFTDMIIMHWHQLLHHAGANHVIASFRSKFFMPRMTRTVKSVIYRCVICKRHQGRPYRYPAAPDLPAERVLRSRPFQHTGLDYFGPINVTVADSSRKVWVCLLTCMASRALHLELVLDNTAHEFLLAFRRFIARRGTPDLLLSDNASTFKLGREVLINELVRIANDTTVTDFTTKNSLQWKFITPLSPWKGGFYERLVGMVKKALFKTVNRNVLHYRTFETLIIEIEATLNTRPLTSLSTASSTQFNTLRPIDLISPYFHVGHLTATSLVSDFFVYDVSDSQAKQELKERHNILVSALDDFWKLWSEDYLQSLAQRSQKSAKKQVGSHVQPAVGDLVIVRTDDMPRARWPLAVITRLNYSKDNSIRSVQIRTARNSLMDRSIKHLVPLEIHVPTEIIAETSSKTPKRIQPPRQAKRVTSH